MSGVLATGNFSPKDRVSEGSSLCLPKGRRISAGKNCLRVPTAPPAPTRLSRLLCFKSLEDINDLGGLFGISELIAQFVAAKNAHQGTDKP